MFAHIAMRRVRAQRALATSFVARPMLLAVAAALTVILQGCSGTPPALQVAADPADPHARVPAASYRPVTGGYTSQMPVEPLPWRERNERVTPPAKP